MLFRAKNRTEPLERQFLFLCRLIICVELRTVETVQCSIANSEVYV